VLRQANDICRNIVAGKSRDEVEHAFAKRAQSLLPTGKPAAFALDEATLAGEPQAPVRVVIYACARCPFCKVIVPSLYRSVTEGALKGKARIYFQPFPLKDHPGSTEGGFAMLAAARLGRFWPFVTKVYDRYDAFCPKLLPEWAAEAGMDLAVFEEKVADPKIREALVTAKQEGIRNKVEATPALFINGRRYVYEMRQDVIADVMLEAYESASALRRKP
jgi:protein-disulfide isomerase